MKSRMRMAGILLLPLSKLMAALERDGSQKAPPALPVLAGRIVNPFRSRRFWGMWGCLLALAVAAQPPAAAPLEKVSLQLKWMHQFQFAGFYTAVEKGYYRDAGLEVQLIEGRSSVDFIGEVASGKTEYGIEMPDLLLRRHAGAPVVVLAAIFQHSPMALMSLAKTGIKSPHDLVSRRVMLGQTSAAEVQAMILSEGMALNQIHWVKHSFNAEDLLQGKAEVASVYLTDYGRDQRLRGVPVSLLKPIYYGIDFYGDCLFTSERELKEHPLRVRAFREASLRGWEYAMTHPEEIARLIHEKYAPKKSVESLLAEATVMETLFLHRFVEIGHMNPGRWRHIGDTYVKLRMLPANYSLKGFLYDPDPDPDYTWLKWLATLAGLAVLALGLVAGTLLVFNRRLDTAVRERTAKLRDSEEDYRSLIESAPDSVFVQSQGQFVYLNPPMLKLLGASHAGKLLGKEVMERVPPEFHKLVHKRIRLQECDPDQPLPPEKMEFLSLDGRRIPVETTAMMVRYQGRAAHLIFVRDITERNQAEAAMQESEARFRTLFENAGDAILLIENGRFVDCNTRTLAMFGASDRGRVVGHAPEELSPQFQPNGRTSQDWGLEKMTAALAGQPQFFEWVHTRCDGTIFPAEVNLNSLKVGEKIFLQAIVRDITERKRTAEAQFRLATAVEQSAEAIVITDTQGLILYVNPAFEKTTGYTCAEVLGQTPRVIKSGKHDDAYYRQMWEALTRGEVWQGHLINQRKDGSLYEEEATISPVRDAAGRIINYVAVKRDVTRVVQLEIQLREAQKLEAIGQLAGGVAHDFNNILAATMMNLGLLQTNPQLDSETRAGLQELEKDARRAASLTRQLLMFGRRSVLETRLLDLNEVVAELLKMLGRLLGEHITLAFERTKTLPLIEADSGMMEQLLMNLVVNARDAMLRGGRITLATHNCEFPAQPPPALPQRPGKFVCLAVCDTGSGIEASTLKRIFEPFFTTKEPGKGTGLGLATVYGIAAQHQGWVEVESQVGQGSCFRVYLPVAGKAKRVAAAPRPEATPTGHETILVVEDDPNVRRVLMQSLKSLGYQLLEAANGREAVVLWQKHGPQIDLLFTDMVMPEGMTGLELADKLRLDRPGLKVIISSGYSAEVTESGKLATAGIRYLPKPYQAPLLGKIVRQCLDEKAVLS